ncbi:MAG: CRISPR-associated RAMP protein Csx7 [Alicyclobacillaceae bacterium]|nr:CRISPR-associated RAMP protein Csx7 [Alicyclobacillaceae bacterium]
MHDRIYNVWVVRGSLELQTPLHVGAGQRGLMSLDAPVLKWPDGRPVVPGSSLKGVLRSFLETVGQNEGLRNWLSPGRPPVCIVTEEPCGKQFRNKKARDEVVERAVRSGTNGTPEEARVKGERELAREIYETLCPVCRLFGNQLFAGKVSVSDLVPEEKPEAGWFDVRDGVGIDRDTRTARRGVKYDFEIVNPGVVFPLTVRAKNLEDDEKAWLLFALEALRRGELLLGGKKSRGLGAVRGVGTWRISRLEPKGPEDFLLRYLGRAEDEDYERVLDEIMGNYTGAGR